VEPAHAHYPWRQLGELLVDQQLLTEDELERALTEQARSGRLLGQILVSNGYLSAFSLARVLSEQHGVVLQAQPEPPHLSVVEQPEVEQTDTRWRPLGTVLVERGFLTQAQLVDALDEQREGHGRLGEILVTRGVLSGAQLAQALAEQQGIDFHPENDTDLTTTIKPLSPEEPSYKVFEVTFEPGFQQRTAVYESPNFLEAADFAFELVERHEPEALEIHRTHGAAQETVWSYSASRAAAANLARKDLVDTFGFDPIRWGNDR
jgi:hypothetical protein